MMSKEPLLDLGLLGMVKASWIESLCWTEGLCRCPIHPLATKRQRLKRGRSSRHTPCSHQASDFATLKATQIATSAACVLFRVEILRSRGDHCQAGFLHHHWRNLWQQGKGVVLLYKGGNWNQQMIPERLQTRAMYLPTMKTKKGSAVNMEGAGTALKSNSWECTLVPVYQGGNTPDIAKPHLGISLS